MVCAPRPEPGEIDSTPTQLYPAAAAAACDAVAVAFGFWRSGMALEVKERRGFRACFFVEGLFTGFSGVIEGYVVVVAHG